jgi:ATP-binding cassette subfamily B (MDR/TAP) protein 1
VVGAALPLMTLVFGSSTSSFNDYAVGQGNSSQFRNSINHLVLYFIYLFIGRFVIGYVATLCICIAAARTTNALRKAFLESLLRKEISHFDLQGNGSAATQVTTNGHRVNQGIAEKLFSLVMGISLFFSSYIVALAVQWKLALITMSIVPAIVLIVGGCISLDAPIEARITRIYSRAATLAQDAIGSVKTIHAFGAQEKIVRWYDEYLQTAHDEGKKKSLIYGVLFCGQTFLVMSGTSLAFWQGFRMFRSGEIENVGTVLTVILSVTLGATSVLLIMPQIQAITNASSAAAELFAIIDKPSMLDPLFPEGRAPNTCVGDIEIRNLTFSYPSRPTAPVLQDLSLRIPAGKTTALVGPSGCGKSTLVGLLERWYQPTSGQILLDGYDLSTFNTYWLRNHIRLVQQEPTLFQGTVTSNVAKGLVGEQLSLSEEQQMQLIQKACIAADAHSFIEKFPEGYDTQLGERASMLSGGQRQRIFCCSMKQQVRLIHVRKKSFRLP